MMNFNLIIIFFLFFNFIDVNYGGKLLFKFDYLKTFSKEKKHNFSFLDKYNIMKRMKKNIGENIVKYFEQLQKIQEAYVCDTMLYKNFNCTFVDNDNLFKIIALIF